MFVLRFLDKPIPITYKIAFHTFPRRSIKFIYKEAVLNAELLFNNFEINLIDLIAVMVHLIFSHQEKDNIT